MVQGVNKITTERAPGLICSQIVGDTLVGLFAFISEKGFSFMAIHSDSKSLCHCLPSQMHITGHSPTIPKNKIQREVEMRNELIVETNQQKKKKD